MDFGSRKIIHIDMDCFYAAIEMRDRPDLKDRPLAVGGSPSGRGVLTTCNYPARRFGIRSALSSREAVKMCPDLVILPIRMQKYREVSSEIYQILLKYSQIVERVSLDEAYIDVTDSSDCNGQATNIAHSIREEIYSTLNLTSSAGIAPNKFLAKIASDWNKPNGQLTIPPAKIPEFIKRLPLKKVPGVGKSFLSQLQKRNFHTCQDLQQLSINEMVHYWGQWGARLFDLCRGVDHSPVQNKRKRKSISVERTFNQDINSWDKLKPWVNSLFDELSFRINKNNIQLNQMKTIGIKLKTNEFENTTLEKQRPYELKEFLDLAESHFYNQNKPIRLLGLTVKLNEKSPKKDRQQLNLL